MNPLILVGHLETWTPLCLGLVLLFICLFTHSYPGQYTYIRLLLAPPAILCFWTFGFSRDHIPPSRTITTGMAVIGWYGIMRVLEHTVIHLWEPESPRWVMRKGSKLCANRRVRCYYHPQTFRERCFYAFDLLTSQRGSSWAGDREWDWIPRRFQSSTWTPPTSHQYITDSTKIFIVEYLILDFIDTICKGHSWDIISLHPVTELPILQQLIFSFTICMGTSLSIAVQYIEVSVTCILCGSSTASWPPMFDSPFLATSLKDFWSRRWHGMFRRVFNRLSVPFVQLAMKISGGRAGGLVTATKFAAGFGFSTVLHLVIMHKVTHWEIGRRGGGPNLEAAGFWDSDVLHFFMAQPIGISFEWFFIGYFADWLFPPQRDQHKASSCRQLQRSNGQSETIMNVGSDGSEVSAGTQQPHHRWERDVITRLFAWCFLLWTGRWWSDKWVRIGFFDKEERVMPVSIIRSLWYGRWSY